LKKIDSLSQTDVYTKRAKNRGVRRMALRQVLSEDLLVGVKASLMKTQKNYQPRGKGMRDCKTMIRLMMTVSLMSWRV
jgi:hypothetical protein